jgi:hypothetical protein
MVNTLPKGYNQYQTTGNSEYMSTPEFDSEYSIDHTALFEAEQARIEAAAFDREHILRIIKDGSIVADARNAHLAHIEFQTGE